MKIKYIEETKDGNIFTEEKELFGFDNFRDFEKNNDDLIFYADGEKDSVVDAMREEFYACPFDCVFFDGWYIALLSN